MNSHSMRLKKGVSLEDISRTTRIRVRYLAAIERGDFAALPGGVYSTSYVRQYAHAIGADEDEMLDRYRRATGSALASVWPAGRRLLAGFLRPLTRVWS